MRLRDVATIVLAPIWLGGCATSALKMAPPSADRPWVPVTSADGEIVAGEAPRPAGRTESYVLPSTQALASNPAPPAVDAGKSYSLPELINLAQSNNPATKVAWNEARNAALATGIAESTYLPRITVSAIGGIQANSGFQSTPGTTYNTSGSGSGAVSALSLQWLLFDFGQRAAIVDAAKQVSVISNIAFTAAHQQVIYNVAVAFYGHTASRARLATATQSLRNAQAVQVAVEDRLKQQIGTVVEVAQARQSTAQANLALVQATGESQDSYVTLITAMGLSPLVKIKIADVSGRNLSPSLLAPVENVIAEALARRPDMQSAYASQKVSLANVRAARAEFMPKFFISANGTYGAGGLSLTAIPSTGPEPPTVNINGNQFGGSILAGVTMPLYDGGTRSARLSQARIDVESAENRLNLIRQNAIRQIVLATNALQTSLAAHTASRSLAAAAQTTFDAALTAYQSGAGTITDLTLAQSQLLQARNASTDSYATALSAAVTLAFSTGALGGPPR